MDRRPTTIRDAGAASPALCAAILSVVLLLLGCAAQAQSSTLQGASQKLPVSGAAAAASARVRAASNFSRLPLQFEQNDGQTDSRVKFLSRGPGYTLFFTGKEAVFAFPAPHGTKGHTNAALRLRFAGGNPDAKIDGEDELPGKTNYFSSGDRRTWHTGIPNYSAVSYRDVYPGVDAVFHGSPQRLEFDFDVAPGADPSKVALDFAGGRVLRVDGDGDVMLGLGKSGGEIKLGKPVVYQEIAGVRHEITGRFILRGSHRVGFSLGKYDRAQRLTIDPTLSYSTFLGGGIGNPGYTYGYAIAVDSSGDAYVSGYTGSVQFPTPNGLEDALPGGTYVSKLSPDGSQLEYTAFLAGSYNGNALAVDSSGSAYVSETANQSFTTSGAYQAGAGSDSITVAKLSPDGSDLIYAAQIGIIGSYPTTPRTGIAVDSQGSAYVVGYTLSPSFPTTAGAWQTAAYGCSNGVCAPAATITKLSPDGSSLVYSTLLTGQGGAADNNNAGEFGYSIAVDTQGDAYVAGTTQSTDFPVTPGAPQPACLAYAVPNAPPFCSSPNAFLTELNPSGSGIVYSTFLGTDVSGGQYLPAVALDSSGNAYLTGTSSAASFASGLAAGPTVSGPALLCPNATQEGCNESFSFVAMFPPGGTQLGYLGFLGGNSPPGAQQGGPLTATEAIAADSSGNAYVTGITSSSYFPVTPNGYQTTLCSDPSACGGAFFSILDTNVAGSSSLTYSTYLGGNDNISWGFGIAVDVSDNAYLTGMTEAQNFPSTPGAYQPACSVGGTSSSPNCENAYVVKFASGLTPPTAAAITAVSGGGQSATIGQAFANPLVVNVTDSSGNPVSGATVTFTAPASGASASLSSSTATTNSSGNASVTATANGIANSTAYEITASVAGASTPATFSLTNTQAATSLIVTPSATSLTYGQTVTLTAAISPSSVEGTMPTGYVTFYDGSTALTPNSAVSAGSASYTVSEPSVGTHTYSAQYLGDSNFLASALTAATSTVTVTTASSGTPPALSTVAGVSAPLAINANSSGTGLNAVLNSDSSVSLVQNGALVSGVSCSAFSSLSGGSLSSGAIYLDGANSRVYLAAIESVSGTTSLYAAYDTFNVSAGTCTQGPLVQLSTNANSGVEMNADIAQGNVYILNYSGAFPDSLYVLPAPWSASLTPPAPFTMDYSVEYGPIVIDPSTHQVFINDLGGSANGAVPGTFATSGFFVYDPNYSGSAPNPEHVAGYMTTSGGAITPFNVGTLLDNGNGTLVLINENPSASSATYSASTPPVSVLNTTTSGFSFFTNTQQATVSTFDITAGNALTTIAPATQYYAVGPADINTAASQVYAFVFNQSTFSGPEELIAYNYAAPQETVLSSSVAMPSQVPDLWQQLNYDPESTEIVLSASEYNSGDLGVTTPLCAGNPSLTILLGSGDTTTPLDFPVVNQDSGYIYAIQPASTYPPPGTPAALEYVAPPASPCSSSQPAPAVINAVSGGGQSAVIGQPFANALTVNVTDANGNPVSGATVTFTAPSSGASATLSATTVTTGSNGNASVTATANGIASPTAYQVSASVAGVSTPASFSLTNTQTPTSLVVTPAATSLTYGQPVTITAAISPASVLSTVPTGSVTFYDGTTALTPNSAVSSAAASYTVNVPTVASHTYAAQYSGDSNFQASALTSASSTVVVNKASVTLAGPATQPVRLQGGTAGSIPATIAGEYTGSGIAAPTGGLNYSVSGNAFGPGSLLVANGSTSIPIPNTLAPGQYTITLSYAGDENYNANSIDIQLVVYSPITISPAALPAGPAGTPYSQTLTASGGSGTGYVWAVQSGTAFSAVGLALTSSGVVSGTPTGTETSASVVVTVTDSESDKSSQTYQLTIYPALAITPATLPVGVVGRAYSQTLTATGGTGTDYQWGVTSGTALSAVGLTLSSAGVISGTPTAPETAAAFIVDVVDSAGDVTTMVYHLTIDPVLAIAPATLPSGIVGGVYSQTLTASGGSGAGYGWAVTSGTGLSAVGLTLSSTGVISGTPTGTETAASFTVEVTDSLGDQVSRPYQLTVYPALAIGPTALPTGTVGTAYSETLTATGGSGAGYTWSTNAAGTVSLGNLGLNLSSTGLISGTPIAAGQASFSAQVTDSAGDTATQSYVLTIISVSPKTIAINDPETVMVNDIEQVQLVDVSDPEIVTVTDIPLVTVTRIYTTTATSLFISPTPANAGQQITFTATVAAATGSAAPIGTVTFTCGQTANSGAISLTAVSGGPATSTASWSTSSLPGGVYKDCAATYTPSSNSNFLSSTSVSESLTVADFTLNFQPPSNLSLLPGQSVNIPLTVSSADAPFNEPIDFSMTGLPKGFTVSFDPSSVTVGSTPQTVTATITWATLETFAQPDRGLRSRAPLVFALLVPFVPLLGLRRMRRRLRRDGWLFMVALLALIAFAGVSSCGGGGFFNQSPQTYTVTLTATSGTVQHSVTFTLTAE